MFWNMGWESDEYYVFLKGQVIDLRHGENLCDLTHSTLSNGILYFL